MRIQFLFLCLLFLSHFNNAVHAAEPATIAADLHGDPLPAGAFARLGTVRFRNGGTLSCLAYSPDDKYLASGDNYGDIVVWDAKEGRRISTFRLENKSDLRIDTIAWSPDSKIIACSNLFRDKVQFWDVANKKLLREVKLNNDHINGSCQNPAGFTNDGKKFVILGRTTLLIFDAATGDEVFRDVTETNDDFSSLAFSSKEPRIATITFKGRLKIFDWERLEKISEVKYDNLFNVRSLAFSSDGKIIAAGTQLGVSVIDAITLKQTKLMNGKDANGNGFVGTEHVAFLKQNKSIIAKCGDGGLRVFDIQSGEQTAFQQRNEGQWKAMALSHDFDTLAFVGNESSAILMMNTRTLEPVNYFEGHTGSIQSVALSPDCKTALTGGWDGTVRMWDIPTGKSKVVQSAQRHSGISIHGLVFSGDGKFFVSATYGKLTFFDSTSLQSQELKWNASIWCLAISPDSSLIAAGSASDGNKIGIFDVSARKLRSTLSGHSSIIDGLAFTPDGKKLISSSRDATVRVWNLEKADIERTWKVSTGSTEFVAIHPDGKSVAFSPHKFDSWSISTGEKLFTFQKEFFHLSDGAYAFDGRLMIASGYDHFHFWHGATGKQLLKIGAPYTRRRIAISRDNKTFITSDGESALLWNIPDAVLQQIEK